MIRLISIIIIFVIFLGFIVLNLDHKSDIALGFVPTFKDVPVFLSVLVSFVLGMLVTVPLLLLRKKAPPKPVNEKPARSLPFKKAKINVSPDELKKEDSPYGID